MANFIKIARKRCNTLSSNFGMLQFVKNYSGEHDEMVILYFSLYISCNRTIRIVSGRHRKNGKRIAGNIGRKN
jgi:hypothetical protein